MSKHEREMPAVGQPKAGHQAQTRRLWGTFPLFSETPLHGEMRTLELAALDADSATPSDYRVYLQLKDKIIDMKADSLIT